MLLQRRAAGLAIGERLRNQAEDLRQAWRSSRPIRHLVIDGLLPDADAREVYRHFPRAAELVLRSSLGRRKRTGTSLDTYHPVIREYLLALHEPEVIAALTDITGLSDLAGDRALDATGISVMGKGDFHAPHLDCSHDNERTRYRILDLLFYLCQDWKEENGGHLELWDDHVTRPHKIPVAFNRLVVMETHQSSWHSVSQVTVDQPRCCLATALFSPYPAQGEHYWHMATFSARRQQSVCRLILHTQSFCRNFVGRMFPRLTARLRQRIYRRP